MKKTVYSFLLLNIVIVGLFWSRSLSAGQGLSEWQIAFGRLFGLLAVLSVLLQFLLMSRAGWLESVFGHDQLAKIHKNNGRLSLLFIVFHPFLIMMGYAAQTRVSIWSQLVSFLQEGDLLQAYAALGLFLVSGISSIYIVRKKLKYHWWYFIHVLTYCAILLSWGHQLEYGSDFATQPLFAAYWYALYLFVFGQVLVFRFLKPLSLFFQQDFQVVKVAKESHDVTSIFITGKNLDSWSVQAGQFVILRFLSQKFWWEAHPFSFSGLPEKNIFRVTIKNVGDFTTQVSQIEVGTRVLIEGPFGAFTSKKSRGEKLLLMAGGIGITPIRTLLETFLLQKKKVILLYAARTKQDLVFKKEIEALSLRYRFQFHYILSQEPRFKGERGRIDAQKLKRLVPDLKSHEVFLCGSMNMMQGIIGELQKLGISRKKIHFEEFAF